MTQKEKIMSVLDETAAVPESMKLLDEIDKKMFEQVLHDEDIKRQFDAYKKNRPVTPVSIELSENRIDEIWNSIIGKSKLNIKTSHNSSKPLFTHIREFFPTAFERMIPIRYVMACLIILAVSSFMVSRNVPWFENHGNGMKGTEVPQAELEYALIGHGSELIRADRVITEKDTLVFRVIAHKQGYYSIGVEYNHRIDWVIRNRFFTAGSFDIQNAYSVEGNSGKNILILVSSESPLDAAFINQNDILKAIEKKSPSISINSTRAHVESRQIIVNRK